MQVLTRPDTTICHHQAPGTLLKVRLQLVVSLGTLYMVNVTATFLFVYYHDGLAMVRPRQVMMVVVIPPAPGLQANLLQPAQYRQSGATHWPD